MPETAAQEHDTNAYARCIAQSKRVRWEIDRDVIRGRQFDRAKVFLPEALTQVGDLAFLAPAEQRLFSQVQGRTYVNLFALLERFIAARAVDMARGQALGDQAALEAWVRTIDDELKHQALFRRLDTLLADTLPAGYRFLMQPNDVAQALRSTPDWVLLALNCALELGAGAHCIAAERHPDLDPLWRDVLHFHWEEESQHAVLDELAWRCADRRLDPAKRDQHLGQFITLLGALDAICRMQAVEDTRYFAQVLGRALDAGEVDAVGDAFVAAYRGQHLFSGAQSERYLALLGEMLDAGQRARLAAALVQMAGAAGLARVAGC